nr:monofunctional biosynthetic peptidoglycan transglycosylase [Pseudooceanicola aestuarii]
MRPFHWLLGWALRIVLVVALLFTGLVALNAVVNPAGGVYMLRERLRLGEIDRQWVDLQDVAPVVARSVVAAEDANFCTHWGFDMSAIRLAIADGGRRGGSTLTQQVAKNLYLWHGRSYVRKAAEAVITPMIEGFWSKRRIVEVYLNIAEFDEGVFGIEAASHHYFGVTPAKLTDVQAARLAAILPSPQSRSASQPGEYVRRQSARIRDGAATIARDGRAACFED